jgi:hypothetical protein
MNLADRDGFIWQDGQLVDWREAKVHVLTHTLHYSMGVFEGVRGGINIGPHIIGINTTGYTGFQFFLWCSGMSAAPTGDFEIGWWER